MSDIPGICDAAIPKPIILLWSRPIQVRTAPSIWICIVQPSHDSPLRTVKNITYCNCTFSRLHAACPTHMTSFACVEPEQSSRRRLLTSSSRSALLSTLEHTSSPSMRTCTRRSSRSSSYDGSASLSRKEQVRLPRSTHTRSIGTVTRSGLSKSKYVS